MITVKTLQTLLAHLPDDATLSAYEGEDTGIMIHHKATHRNWFIRATEAETEDGYTEGFSITKNKQ